MEDKSVILAVDDEAMNVGVLEALLKPRGYEIVAASNGLDALKIMNERKIDLVLLDVMMQGIDGFEVTRRIRQNESTRLVPVVLVTALSETEDRIKGIEAGCDDFISKPFDKIEVIARVKMLLKMNFYRKQLEEKEKEKIKNVFGHYLSREVMDELLKDPLKLKLGGERKLLTVLFSDIKGFTAYSEKRQPEEVVMILNEYFEEMTKIIFRNKGTVDKFAGDQIMAVFGAPSTKEDTTHAERAVITAWEMISCLRQMQEKWRKENREPFDIGIGINSGPMLVGNIGSSERMDYTVIGDAVNLARRVEQLTRQYNNHIIISEFTLELARDLVEVKKLDAIQVKGKDESVLMYEVINLKSS